MSPQFSKPSHMSTTWSNRARANCTRAVERLARGLRDVEFRGRGDQAPVGVDAKRSPDDRREVLASVVDDVVGHGSVGASVRASPSSSLTAMPVPGRVADGIVDLILIGDGLLGPIAVEAQLPQVHHFGELGLALVFRRAECGDRPRPGIRGERCRERGERLRPHDAVGRQRLCRARASTFAT